MTGSVALDVVIGLVFIYLLYSLLATVVCEIVANYWGLRARNLLYSIERMLEDSPLESEKKIIAVFRQIKDATIRLFDTPEGPASCVFYRLPVIKYLAKNTFHSKPSYITRQTFSKALFEIFRIYGGSAAETDLEKIHNVLNGRLEHKGLLKEIRDEIVESTEDDDKKTDEHYSKIFDSILKKIREKGKQPIDATQAKLCKKIRKRLRNPAKLSKEQKKDIVYQIDEMLNLFGHETRSHMRSLLKDANDDLFKFRLLLEQWFDDTQDRAAGWYKQQIQVLLLFIGLAFAVFFNANTIDIVHKLSIDKDARDKMVQLASDYLKDPNSVTPDTSEKPLNDSSQSIKFDSLKKARADSVKKVQEKLRQQIDDANSLIGAGWPEMPDSLPLLKWTQALEDSLSKLAKNDELHYSVIELDTLIRDTLTVKTDTLFKKGFLKKMLAETLKKFPLDSIAKINKDTVVVSHLDNIRILIYPNTMTNAVLGCLEETWYWGGERYTGFNTEMSKIKIESGFFGSVLYIVTTFFSKTFWGFLLTAIAISLGAPFWFDLLNKLMQIRGSVREPTQAQSGTAAASAGSGTSDPAHPINRKG